jgi:hypothetical protein
MEAVHAYALPDISRRVPLVFSSCRVPCFTDFFAIRQVSKFSFHAMQYLIPFAVVDCIDFALSD